MALNYSGEVPDIVDRFMTAQSTEPATDIDERKRIQNLIQREILNIAETMAVNVKNGRELSLALTHLEEALMWTGKAIFKN